MRKSLLISLLVLGLFAIKLNVNADNSYATSSDDAFYSMLVSGYNGNTLKSTSISSAGTITLYGKSECNGTSCTYHYSGNNSTLENALSKAVTCTGGEQYITYQGTGEGGKTTFMEDNKAGHDGIAYWSEDYYVTCTSSNNGDSTVELDNSVNDNANNNGGNYGSADQGEQEELGVNTYFVVLGLVSVVSYAVMTLVKKYNLFKNI